jgi:CheY-like chemotaxis protein
MQQVLVVDDDGIYRTIMMRVLARAGFSVSGVRSGAEALDHLEQGTPKPRLAGEAWFLRAGFLSMV